MSILQNLSIFQTGAVFLLVVLFLGFGLMYIANNNKREENRTALKHQLIMQRFNVNSTEYLLEKESDYIEGYTLLVHGKKYRVIFTTRYQNDDVQLIKIVNVPF